MRRSRLGAALGCLLATLILLVMVPAVAGAAPIPGGSLDPTTVPKYATPLTIPPAMPTVGSNRYEIAVRQFDQQILPLPFQQTTVWSYGSAQHPGTFNYPAFTIEADVDTPATVKWINDLVDENGDFLPHLLPVDQTLHWANPAGGAAMRDHEGDSQEPYVGPVPMVTHVHGAHVGPESDGYPEAWYLPAADDIPSGYATRGTKWDQIAGVPIEAGAATFRYPNDQPASTLWYHDHTLGMTRVNVYAGPAGFYLLRGGDKDLAPGVLPGPAPALGDPANTKYYEIPIAIQDRSFNDDGSLFYPDNRAFFEGLEVTQLQIPFIPEFVDDDDEMERSDVSPIWNPEFFGNTIVVNGKTWPYLEVEPRRYRLRLLNGSQSRFYILETDRPLTFWQIGAEGGFLPEPVEQTQLLLGPAERADVIVDFSEYVPGDEIILENIGPDEPFGGGTPGVDFPVSDPDTTGQVMQFRVVASTGEDTTVAPQDLDLPAPPTVPASDITRRLSLNEEESETVLVSEDAEGNLVLDEEGEAFGPTEALLGTLDAAGNPVPLGWDEAITENPLRGNTETWEIHNFTADAHPIHIHMVQFQVLERGGPGAMRGPEEWESGLKDTVIAYPGEITRVRATFDLAGLFVWHCHILEHEDNEMMRPYEVSRGVSSTAFPDVSQNHEFRAAILALAGEGIVDGYANGRYGLYDPVLRAQLAKMAVLGFDKHTAASENMTNPTFRDVTYNPASPYPFDFVEEAALAGYVRGYADDTFRPFQRLTRVQLVRVLVRAAGDTLADPPAGYKTGFTDVAAMDVAVVAKAKFNGVIDGKSATIFDPYGVATRGHVAKILNNVLQR